MSFEFKTYSALWGGDLSPTKNVPTIVPPPPTVDSPPQQRSRGETGGAFSGSSWRRIRIVPSGAVVIAGGVGFSSSTLMISSSSLLPAFSCWAWVGGSCPVAFVALSISLVCCPTPPRPAHALPRPHPGLDISRCAYPTFRTMFLLLCRHWRDRSDGAGGVYLHSKAQ